MAKDSKGIQSMAKGRQDLFKLDPKDINMDPEWNVRIKTPELKEHIATLARSIAEIGMQQPITVRMVDKKPWVTDGFCRMAAVNLAIENGADIQTVPVRVEERYSNEADHTLSLLTRNSGKPLATIEQAFVIKRLLGHGWDKKEIQDKTGFSVTHVNNMLDLLAAPPEIIAMLKHGKVSVRHALKTIKEKGSDKATAALKKDIERSTAAGKNKATSRTAGKTDNKPRIAWGKHGPILAKYITELGKARDLDGPGSTAAMVDQINIACDYIADNELEEKEESE